MISPSAPLSNSITGGPLPELIQMSMSKNKNVELVATDQSQVEKCIGEGIFRNGLIYPKPQTYLREIPFPPWLRHWHLNHH